MYEFLDYRVRDVMTRAPVTIGPRAAVRDAEALLELHDFNALPVVDPGDRLLGIVTKLDLLAAFAFTPESIVPEYEEVMGRPVESVMTRALEPVEPDAHLTRVLQRMVETRYKSFPVVEQGRLVGMIAREDILRALRRAVAGQGPRD